LDRPASLEDGDRSGVVGGQELDQAEIHQLESTARGEPDVGGLDVTVKDGWILAVEVVQGIAELVGPGSHLFLLQEPALAAGLVHDFFEVAAGHEVHDQIVPPPLREIVGDLGQIGVIEPGQHTRFALELLSRLGCEVGLSLELNFFDGAQPSL